MAAIAGVLWIFRSKTGFGSATTLASIQTSMLECFAFLEHDAQSLASGLRRTEGVSLFTASRCVAVLPTLLEGGTIRDTSVILGIAPCFFYRAHPMRSVLSPATPINAEPRLAALFSDTGAVQRCDMPIDLNATHLGWNARRDVAILAIDVIFKTGPGAFETPVRPGLAEGRRPAGRLGSPWHLDIAFWQDRTPLDHKAVSALIVKRRKRTPRLFRTDCVQRTGGHGEQKAKSALAF